ncbi:dienelactone hydrolase family protein [Terrimonas pollutisoli]|uniref:dienelactone hydrolase family protein n=1 Tax=Terrimonas pollutisoli TaxID=3034147 RepID=UPI0023ED665E|nr:dienelactone hydrolase family protein [Terrimonas sp. H1YJ31]
MRTKFFINLAILIVAIFFSACNNESSPKEKEMKDSVTTKTPSLKEDNVIYTGDNVTMNGYVVYDENKEGTRPAVLVIHEWWGLNDYAKSRAKQLAELGYIAMAVDMYGNGKTADNPDSASKYATPFYQKPQMTKARFDAALEKLKTYPQTDATKIAAIGYCFGGAQVLNLARMGEDLKGVVSFHGNLLGVPLDKSKLKAEVLVCHGAADPFVPQKEVDMFKKQMDSVGAKYTFKAYEGAVHAFTNPNATAMGEKFKIPIKYDAAADSASWNDMKAFFGRIF